MLSDPQSVTPTGGSAVSLPRTSSGVNTGGFKSSDGATGLGVSHQYGKRTRRQIRLDFSKIVPDELVSSVNNRVSMSAYLVVDVPTAGYTLAETQANVGALTAWLTASSGANLAKVLGGES